MESVLQAALVSLLAAFIVLLAMTRSLTVSFIAFCAIASTMLTVIATLVLMGWELGAIEAISISILAGVAVDFVVHLGLLRYHQPVSSPTPISHNTASQAMPMSMHPSVIAPEKSCTH